MKIPRTTRRRGTGVIPPGASATTFRGGYEGSWDDRESPSFFSRLRRVLGCRPRTTAAPRAPSMTHRVRWRTARICAPLHVLRAAAGRLGDGPDPGLAEDVGVDLERGAGRQDDSTFEDVLELAHVPRPRVRHQPAQRAGLDPLEPPPDARRELVEEELRQEWDVLGPLAERRERQREDAEPVVQVLAERLLADGLRARSRLVAAMDPNVDLPRRRSADAVELVLLQDAEELGLAVGGELADLVEEDRPPVGELEPARVPGDRPCERALLVAGTASLSTSARGQGRAVDLG